MAQLASHGQNCPLAAYRWAERALQPYAPQIEQIVKQQPDATLEELCAAIVVATRVPTTPSMMWRELQHLLSWPLGSSKFIFARFFYSRRVMIVIVQAIQHWERDDSPFDRRSPCRNVCPRRFPPAHLTSR